MMNKGKVLKFIFVIILLLIGFIFFKFLKYDYSTSNETIESESESAMESKEDLGKIIKPTTYSEIDNLLNNDKTSMVVIGKTGCEYCQMYMPELKKVIANYKIDIIYIDIVNLSKDDYRTLLNSELTIPATCNDDGVDEPLNKGFGTPLTLFVNNRKSVDCIRGYTTNDAVLDKIKKNNAR